MRSRTAGPEYMGCRIAHGVGDALLAEVLCRALGHVHTDFGDGALAAGADDQGHVHGRLDALAQGRFVMAAYSLYRMDRIAFI